MKVLGIYVYNATADAWLQPNLVSWGPWRTATAWTEGMERDADGIRKALADSDETHVMAALTGEHA